MRVVPSIMGGLFWSAWGDSVSRLDAPLPHGDAWDTAAFSFVYGQHGVPPVLRFGGPNGVQPCAGLRSGRRLCPCHRGGAAHVLDIRRERGCEGLAACSGCRRRGDSVSPCISNVWLWKADRYPHFSFVG